MTIQTGWKAVMCALAAVMLAVCPSPFFIAQASPDEGEERSGSDAHPPATERLARSEERTLASLVSGRDTTRTLSRTTRELRIPFRLAPGAMPEGAELVLAARPRSRNSGGRLEAFIAGARTIALSPRAENFEARFALYSESLSDGENLLVIRFDAGEADGWEIDLRASRLRITAMPGSGHDSLASLETALAAHFAAPRRVHIDASGAGRDQLAVEALTAQGLALRMGEAPVLVGRADAAELVVRAGIDPLSPGASISLADPFTLRLAGSDATNVAAAARMFAARSLAGTEARMTPATALSAPQLVRVRDRERPNAAGLQALAEAGAPFSRERGGRAAIVIAADSAEDRLGGLTLLSRAALASGSAWLYAWYGAELETVPAGHDLMVLGPLGQLDDRLLRSAPAEVRAAAQAASRRIPRPRRSYGSTAFAAEGTAATGAVTGIAGLYNDADGRTVVLVTSPEGADFSRAARRLARSDLWTGLSGQAMLWDSGTLTAFGPTANSGLPLRERVSEIFRTHDRLLAGLAFGLAVLLLLAGSSVNRRSTARS